MAASQCPKCGHPFAVRDGFGELLPLAHCPTCGSDYPLHLGECRWCGTKPERAPLRPYVWKGAGIAAFVCLAWGAWLVHDDTPAGDARRPSASRLVGVDTTAHSAPSPVDSVAIAYRTLVGADSADTAIGLTRTNVVSADTATRLASAGTVQTDPVEVQSAGAVARQDRPDDPAQPAKPVDAVESTPLPPRASVAPPAAPTSATPSPSARSTKGAPARAVPPRSVVAKSSPPRSAPKAAAKVTRAPARAVASSKATAKATARKSPPVRTSGRWVSSVARRWVVVRGEPSHRSRIIASIGPNTRVQLGESRGAWRRIKARGVSGWVEHRSLVASMDSPRKAGRLAAR